MRYKAQGKASLVGSVDSKRKEYEITFFLNFFWVVYGLGMIKWMAAAQSCVFTSLVHPWFTSLVLLKACSKTLQLAGRFRTAFSSCNLTHSCVALMPCTEPWYPFPKSHSSEKSLFLRLFRSWSLCQETSHPRQGNAFFDHPEKRAGWSWCPKGEIATPRARIGNGYQEGLSIRPIPQSFLSWGRWNFVHRKPCHVSLHTCCSRENEEYHRVFC